MDFNTELSLIVQLSLIDGNISQTEESLIYTVGRSNGMTNEEIEKILHHHLRHAVHELPDMSNLTEDDKISILYNVIKMMKADQEIYLTEIKFCENIAGKLGYKKNVVKELSTKIMSDGTVSADIDFFREVVAKYRL